jgi:hypothetical protein
MPQHENLLFEVYKNHFQDKKKTFFGLKENCILIQTPIYYKSHNKIKKILK